MLQSRKEHWEKVYTSKQPHEMSWTQEVPQTSLHFINSFQLPKSASIIDVGGGDSNLVDFLLKEEYENITVLDISEEAIKRSKGRLGKKAEKVKWIVGDINDFTPETVYDIWHDRATFHFLTAKEQVEKYLELMSTAARNYLIMGTFSKNGPAKCSGLEVEQYNESKLTRLVSSDFRRIKCITEDHKTPFSTMQNFLFCSFKRIS
jgi:cyclopropane fatty-acyl-phospholipid synthase-like methyltransferase